MQDSVFSKRDKDFDGTRTETRITRQFKTEDFQTFLHWVKQVNLIFFNISIIMSAYLLLRLILFSTDVGSQLLVFLVGLSSHRYLVGQFNFSRKSTV